METDEATVEMTPIERQRVPEPRRGWRPGFTMMELLVTLFLSTIAMVTIYGMQTAANVIQRNARDINSARMLAMSFLTRLRGEALDWNSDADINSINTPLIHWALSGSVGVGGGPGQWVAVPSAGGLATSPLYNALGIPEDPTDPRTNLVTASMQSYNQRYCIHYNLQWVGQVIDPLNPSGELLRAQVRVFWPTSTESFSSTVGVDDCGYTDPEGMAARLGQFRYLQMNTVLFRHEAWL